MRRRLKQNQHSGSHHDSLSILALGALGVVFGDIGTSPLYALRECLSAEHGIPVNADNIYGILSLIFWSLFVTVSLKYVSVIMKADNRGEGGILSLLALATGGAQDDTRKKAILVTLGFFGAALLYGDGVITPAISVLSAVEGLKVMTPVFTPFIIPITVTVLALLFLLQRFGTGRIGSIFGPIMIIWFLVLAAMGIHQILLNPSVLHALNPYFGINFLVQNGEIGFLVLGSVFLVVTGGEALYADMGHFGRSAIRLAWFGLAMPALTLNYFGQGALLLAQPEAISNPFYLMAPQWGLGSLVLLSTCATIIASQALISGCYSITKQAVQLGFAPRLQIIHTSSKEIGQIYIPLLNWALLAGVIWLVLVFKTSSELAAAYGLAVTGTMMITTILAYEVARRTWGWSRFRSASIFGAIFIIDMAFFIPNLSKVEKGGWVALLIAAVIYLLMSTWRKGRRILARVLKEKSLPLDQFIKNIEANPPIKVPGAAIYMSSDLWGVPVPLLHNLKHNKVLHNQIALLTIRTTDVPFIEPEERVRVEELSQQFYRIVAEYGFMETPKIKHILDACRAKGISFPIQETTFVLGRETILPVGDNDLPIWREKIFALMSRNAERPTAFFKIPPNQVIEVGIQVEI